VVLAGSAPAWVQAVGFEPVQQIAVAARGTNLSRGASSLAADTGEQFHLVYIARDLDKVYVRYTSRNAAPGDQWQEPITLRANPREAGHPSIAVLPDGARFVAWHDYRHGTAAGNYIDNVEIYLAAAPANGGFGEEIRVTETAAGHLGDNGYMPFPTASPDGSHIALVWYDFFYDGHISDLFGIVSSPGSFASLLPVDLSAARLTNLSDRGGAPPFVLPEALLDDGGTMHVVFTSGFSDQVGDLFYLRREAGGRVSPVDLLATAACSYFAPPHLARGPDGSIWLAWADRTQGADQRTVKIARLASEIPTLHNSIIVTPIGIDCTSPDLSLGSDGLIRVVWLEITRVGFFDTESDVYYATVDPHTGEISQPSRLNEEGSGPGCPTIAVTPQGTVAVVWEQPSEDDPNVMQIMGTVRSNGGAVEEWVSW
jgi:hypothetical protein